MHFGPHSIHHGWIGVSFIRSDGGRLVDCFARAERFYFWTWKRQFSTFPPFVTPPPHRPHPLLALRSCVCLPSKWIINLRACNILCGQIRRLITNSSGFPLVDWTPQTFGERYNCLHYCRFTLEFSLIADGRKQRFFGRRRRLRTWVRIPSFPSVLNYATHTIQEAEY